ncbi:hypothetical protein BHM03_00035296 [Ensete ventricosum]|nr:hypothetical protein BHM03_00035296 [Ensete ventricosum]
MSRFSLRPTSDTSGVKLSILSIGKITSGGRTTSVPKARLLGDSPVGVFSVVHRAHRMLGSSSTQAVGYLLPPIGVRGRSGRFNCSDYRLAEARNDR